MNDPTFLDIFEVLQFHDEQITLFGGEPGIHDATLLEAALAVPESGIDGQYFHSDIYAMAAAYLNQIVKDCPFNDGNKRAGLASALIFLAINGCEAEYDPDELAELVLSVASGKTAKDDVAKYFRTANQSATVMLGLVY